MIDELRVHVNGLFSAAPATRRSLELQEELIGNLQARYDDLIAEGESPAAAYKTVIDSIGDVGDLIEMLKSEEVLYPEHGMDQRKRNALLVSGATALYVLCVIPALLLPYPLGVVLLLLLCAAATGLLTYTYLTRPKYTRRDDSLVEEFKEWTADSKRNVLLRRIIDAATWSLALLLFFLIGFFGPGFHLAWLTFILGFIVSQVVRLLFVYMEEEEK